MFLQKYQEPVNNFYAETKNEEILGSVLVSCPSLNQNELHSFQEKRKVILSKQKTTTRRELILDLYLDI